MVKKKDEAPWGQGLINQIKWFCTQPHMNAARLLRILENDMIHGNEAGTKNTLNTQAAQTYGYRRYRDGGPIFRLSPLFNHYVLFPAQIHNDVLIPSVADLIDEDTEAVVELGCGFGRHLFGLRDVLEHQFPQLGYFGGDISDEALEGGRAIAALERGRKPIVFQKFDYLAPSLAFLTGLRRVVYFTSHSIEQVQTLGSALFDEMLKTPSVRCLHGEPVGWQFNTELMKKVADGTFPTTAEGMRVALHGEIDDYYSAYTPVNSGWNRDLVRQLQRLEAAKRIKIEFVERSVTGDHVYNPTTHIQWSKIA